MVLFSPSELRGGGIPPLFQWDTVVVMCGLIPTCVFWEQKNTILSVFQMVTFLNSYLSSCTCRRQEGIFLSSSLWEPQRAPAGKTNKIARGLCMRGSLEFLSLRLTTLSLLQFSNEVQVFLAQYTFLGGFLLQEIIILGICLAGSRILGAMVYSVTSLLWWVLINFSVCSAFHWLGKDSQKPEVPSVLFVSFIPPPPAFVFKGLGGGS